jgi:hypothetical protein
MSPTFSTSQFSSTSSWFPGQVHKHHLGRKDVIGNIRAFEALAQTCKEYEDAIKSAANASMRFAEALEHVSRAKDLSREEEDDQDDLVEGFRSLAGYQFYMGSQQRVLAQLLHEQCTSPLQTQLDAYRNTLVVCVLLCKLADLVTS